MNEGYTHALVSCKNYKLATLFPARDVALGCVFLTLEDAGLINTLSLSAWINETSSGKVDTEDFKEVVTVLRSYN